MTDEIQAAASVLDPAGTGSLPNPSPDALAKLSEGGQVGVSAPAVEGLQATVVDLQNQLAAAKDASIVTERALDAANKQNDQLLEAAKARGDEIAQLKSALNARHDGADEHAAGATALIAGYEHSMETNSPRTMTELNTLKALLLGS